jgi:hypothetical protein
MKWLGLLKKRVFTILLSLGFILTAASASQAAIPLTLQVNTYDTAGNTVNGTWHLNGQGIGAQTGLSGNYDWQVSGATVHVSTAAAYTISFGDIPGYTKPADAALAGLNTAAVIVGKAATGSVTNIYFTGAVGYVKDTSTNPEFYGHEVSLQVNITPTNASDGILPKNTLGVVGAGAQWSIDGGTIYNNSGDVISAPRAYTITFKSVSGWRTPNDMSGTFDALGTTSTVTGVTGNGKYCPTVCIPAINTPFAVTMPYLHAVNDYNGDGRSEVLFRNVASGDLYSWDMSNGYTVSSGGYIDTNPGAQATVFSPGAIVAQADFNGDGVTDLLFENTTTPVTTTSRALTLWIMSGADGVVSQSNTITLTRTATDYVVGAADFTGDGRADILMLETLSSGRLTPKLVTLPYNQFDNAIVANGAAMTPVSTTFNKTISQTVVSYGTHTGWHVAAIADFNGDGKADVLFRFASRQGSTTWADGQTSIWYMDGATRLSNGAFATQLGFYKTWAGLTGTQVAKGWFVAGVGDFDGDGYTDILFRNAAATTATSADATGQTVVWLLTGADASGIPVKVANGVNTAAFASRGSGSTVDNAGTSVLNAGNFTATGGWQVTGVGDFNGDGRDDVLWRYAGTGHTYVWLMNGRSATSAHFTSVYPGTVGTWDNTVMRTVLDPQ